jgi:hypothetical protein
LKYIKPLLSFFFFLFIAPLFAQQGTYYISHYSPDRLDSDPVTFDILQNKHGVMHFAGKRGLVLFDGTNWEQVATPGAIFSLALGFDNTVYMGGRNGLGKLVLNETYERSYEPLIPFSRESRDIFSLVLQGDTLFAINQERLYLYSIQTEEIIATVEADAFGEFYGMAWVNGDLLVNTNWKGVMRLEKNTLVPFNNSATEGTMVLFASPTPGRSRWLVGLDNGTLWIQEKGKWTEIKGNEASIIREMDPFKAEWINYDLVAISTLRSGVVFFDTYERKIVNTVSYGLGLPDNEMQALYKDKNGGIWVAHDYGYSRIATNLPFQNFSIFKGLEGNLLAVNRHQGHLYVATTLGVFRLEEVKDYREFTVTIQETVRVAAPRTPSATQMPEPKEETPPAATEPVQETQRKGVLGFLKKKRDNVTGSGNQETEPQPEKPQPTQPTTGTPTRPTPTQPRTRIKTTTETRRELVGVSYQFKKVAGISTKTNQLITHGRQLLAAGPSGLFDIDSMDATPIIKEPIRFLHLSKDGKTLLASTYHDEVIAMERRDNKWEPLSFFEGFRKYISSISEYPANTFWLCGTEEVIRVTREKGSFGSVTSFSINNPYFDQILAGEVSKEFSFVNSSGVYSFGSRNELLAARNQEDIPEPEGYLADNLGHIWFWDGLYWHMANETKQTSTQRYQLLSLFEGIRHIARDPNGSTLWVIDSRNELFAFDTEMATPIKNVHEVFLKEIRNPTSRLIPKGRFRISQNESSITFEFVQPDFLGAKRISYRYILEGLSSEWSQWSDKQSIVQFPYLPDGKYGLKLQSKNIFGEISQAETVYFEVVPPYWHQSWFYALEFCVFGIMLLLVVRFMSLDEKYHWMGKLLALITLVMFIEFVQAISEGILGGDSPVMNFFVQVGIALLLLPLELGARKYISKEKQVGGTVRQIMRFFSKRPGKV